MLPIRQSRWKRFRQQQIVTLLVTAVGNGRLSLEDLAANRDRLRRGLKKNGDPAPAKSVIHGSYAMGTVIQEPESAYDIDDGVVFTAKSLIGPRGASKTALDPPPGERTWFEAASPPPMWSCATPLSKRPSPGGTPGFRQLLDAHPEPVPWLDEYVRGVIDDLAK